MMARLMKLVVVLLVCGIFFCAPAFAQDKVNINTASVEQLTTLPGIGPAIAAKIVEHREGHAFANVGQGLDVKGIGQAKYNAIKDLITVGEPAAKKQ